MEKRKLNKHIFTLLFFVGVLMTVVNVKAQVADTSQLIYPIPQDDGNPFNQGDNSGLYFQDPDNITRENIYCPVIGSYIISLVMLSGS